MSNLIYFFAHYYSLQKEKYTVYLKKKILINYIYIIFQFNFHPSFVFQTILSTNFK